MLGMEPPKKKQKLSWNKIKKEGLDLDYNQRFLTKHEADDLLEWFEKNVEYFSGDLAQVKVFGKWHKIPRKQVSYGEAGLSYKFSGNTVPALPWPDQLASLRDRLNEATSNKFNFVLVNRYKDGNDHMGYHRDDEADLDQTAPIASISLGQTRDFVFQHADARRVGSAKRDVPTVKISLTHGSLLMMNPPTNTHWYHSLPKRKNCPGVRINLTFRTMIVKPKR
ncbi:DNA oxidative demethylase ALKBH2-like [Macrosteles quadrilineatus]|uniref:DNA oxidative demethylase ALKBH2-like n=1 Tax=Macrosteles quadrilineatus TaxID=74068 RepID=UPI0023E28C7B|nr:DNA oxidative demethylase ALKBH2-like [Macrosteles quadrilineatus]